MALSGSDLAYKQARAGIARAGATRCGFFTPNVVLHINGVDRSASLLAGSLQIVQTFNDEPDTARFTLKPGVIPTEGQLVFIGLGTADNREFGGQAVLVTHRRRPGHESPWVEVECIDWHRLFDRRTITKEYTSQSATDIAKDIVDSFTSGFTRLNIVEGLATIASFSVVNGTPSKALRRLANLLGGGFYVDATRDVHLFGSAGEAANRAPTAPRTITNSLSSLKRGRQVFTHTYDGSQIRTRVIAEGQRTRVPLIGIPVGATTIPLQDSSMFNDTGGKARLGTQRITYTARNYPVDPGSNASGTHVRTAAAAGATTLAIDDNAFVAATGTSWVQVGEQVIRFTGSDPPPTAQLVGIPASGYGSLQSSVGVGDAVTALGELLGIPSSGAGSVQVAQPKDTEVVMYVQVDDAAAQAVVAAIEGGDGIHEHPITDHRWNEDGATAAANAELVFDTALIRASWETEDMNAKPGRPQVINLTVTDALSVTLTITRAELFFDAPNYRPRRVCQAAVVRVAGILDVVETDAG